MNQLAITPSTEDDADNQSVSSIVEWLRGLEECRVSGMLSDEDFFVQRAEKLSEILCEHRYLWVAPIAATAVLAALAGGLAYSWKGEVQVALMAAGLAGLFGVVILARPWRDRIKEAQICDRLKLLNGLLEHDLISSDEFLAYEERLNCGGRTLDLVSNL